MFPECMLSLSSTYPTNNFYSLLKLPLLGYEPKRTVFVFVPLHANELALPPPFSEEGGASRAHAPAHRQQQNRTISRNLTVLCIVNADL